MKEVVNINDSVASKIVVDSSKLGNSLVKDGKVTDQGKTIFRFSKGDSEVYYYYHEDKRLEIFYGSLSKEISRFSNSIEITDFKNKDFSLLLPFGIAFVDFIEEEAKKNGKQIDNVTKISLLNYYDDKGSNARKTFLHDHTMLMLKDTSISAFNLSKELVPSNLKKRYNLAKGANIELELSNIWKEYRCAMEKCINEDLSHCRKKNYITKNTTTIPEDSEIDYLMAAYRIDKESFAFFKSFQRLTQVERDEKAEEEKRIAQEEKLKSTTKPKETVVAKDEGKPSLRNIGKNGSLGKLP